MNYKLLIISALAVITLILASCTKDELKPEQPRTFTITASMPTDGPHINATTGTRMTFAPGGTDNKGITTGWETTDELWFSFNQGTEFYWTKAFATNISSDKKTADFTITLPDVSTGFNNATPFNLQCFFQNGGSQTFGGFQLASIDNDRGIAERCIDLDGDYRIRPFLRYKHATALNAGDLAALNIPLQHEGYVVALHIRNTTASQQNLPDNIRILSADYPSTKWTQYRDRWMLNTDTWEYGTLDYYIRFQFRNADTDPYRTIGANETVTVYRWAFGDENTPELRGSWGNAYASGSIFVPANNVPAKPGLLKKGTCVHLYVTWDGTDMTFGR